MYSGHLRRITTGIQDQQDLVRDLTYTYDGALKTVFFTGLSAGIASAIGASGLDTLGGFGAPQGTLSVLQGGNFGAGFALGFMRHGARSFGARQGFGLPEDSERLMGRMVVAAMVGGLSSRFMGLVC